MPLFKVKSKVHTNTSLDEFTNSQRKHTKDWSMKQRYYSKKIY